MTFEEAIKQVELAHYLAEQDAQARHKARLFAIRKSLVNLLGHIEREINDAKEFPEAIQRLNSVHNATTFLLDIINWK